MPRKRSTEQDGDFRTPEQMRADERLLGTWWRCQEHGLVTDPIILADVPYCSADECTRRVVLAHSAMRDPSTPFDQPVERTRTEFAMRAPKPPAPAAPPAPRRKFVPTDPEVLRRRRRIYREAAREAAARLRRRNAGVDGVAAVQAPEAAQARAEAVPVSADAQQVQTVTGAAALEVRTIRRGGAWACEVCQRRHPGTVAHVGIVEGEFCLHVCAQCAAEGDAEMRAAAAPLLRRSSRRSA